MTTFTPPSWLKTSALACYVPEKIIFQPERRVIFRNAQPHLLDCQQRPYPLAHCEPLQLQHLNGVALFVSESEILSIYRDRTILSRLGSQGFIVTDGTRKLGVRIAAPDSLDAAKSLANFFDGSIYTEDICP